MSFNDEHDNTPTCYKLECGHAYHTTCIIKTLSQSERKCPSCNGEKDASTLLTEKGLAVQLIAKVKKAESVKMSLAELKQAVEEYSESVRILKADVKAFVAQRSTELSVFEKKKYFNECLASVRRNALAEAKQLNPQVLGAFKAVEDGYRYWRVTPFEKVFYGKTMSLSLARSKYPRLWVPLY